MGDEQFSISEEILTKITSKEATQVTRYLSVIFIRLVRAPRHLWERDNVLRLKGEVRDGQTVSAWEQLVALVKVSPKTARRALSWLHSEGVIVYATDDRTEIVISFKGISGRATQN